MEKEKLPERWKTLPIGKCVVDDLSGFACSQSKLVKEGGYVQLRPFNIEDGKLNLDTLYQVPVDIVDESKYYLEKGDILFNNTNSTELVGKSAIAEKRYPFAFSNHINRIRVDTNLVVPQFFHNYLLYMWVNGHFAKYCKKWIGQSGYTLTALKKQFIPLPPLDIQEKIVAKVDKQMAEIARMKKEAEGIKINSGDLFRSYLFECFKEFSTTKKLEDLVEDIKNGIYKPDFFRGTGQKLVRMYNIDNRSIKLNDENLEFIELTTDEIEKYTLKENDIIISRVNSDELVGKCGIVKEKLVGCAFENMVIRVRVKENAINPEYLSYFLISSKGKAELKSIVKRAINQSSISNRDLKTIEIPLPPDLYTQKSIAEGLNYTYNQIEQIEKYCEIQLNAINQLSSSILYELFGKYEIPDRV